MDDMKKYLLERGLRPRIDFAKEVSIETPSTLDDFLLKAQAYIQYKEKEAAKFSHDTRHRENVKSSKNEDPSVSRRGGERRREDKPCDSRDHKGPVGRFSDYTPHHFSGAYLDRLCEL